MPPASTFFLCKHRLLAQISLYWLRLTWPEDGEDEDARDENYEDAMTEAKDEPVVEDASSSACGVTSEGRKTLKN